MLYGYSREGACSLEGIFLPRKRQLSITKNVYSGDFLVSFHTSVSSRRYHLGSTIVTTGRSTRPVRHTGRRNTEFWNLSAKCHQGATIFHPRLISEQPALAECFEAASRSQTRVSEQALNSLPSKVFPFSRSAPRDTQHDIRVQDC